MLKKSNKTKGVAKRYLFGALPACQETEQKLEGHQLSRDLEGVDRWLMIKEEQHEHMLTQTLCASAAATAAEALDARRPQATPARANPPRPAVFSSMPPVPWLLTNCLRRESRHIIVGPELELQSTAGAYYIALEYIVCCFLVGLCVVVSFWACFGGDGFVVRVMVCCFCLLVDSPVNYGC